MIKKCDPVKIWLLMGDAHAGRKKMGGGVTHPVDRLQVTFLVSFTGCMVGIS